MNDNFTRFSASLHPFQRIRALISIRFDPSRRESRSLNRDLIVFLPTREDSGKQPVRRVPRAEIFESDSSRWRGIEFEIVLRSEG